MSVEIAVVGHGATTCLGTEMETTWNRILQGDSGLRVHHDRLPSDRYLQSIAGLVDGVGPGTALNDPAVSRLGSRFIHLGLKAARDAWSDSEISEHPFDSNRVAVVFGTGLAGLDLYDSEAQKSVDRRSKATSPYLVPGLIANQVGGQISEALQLHGPSLCPANACATGGHSVAMGALLLDRGEADIAICGASESAFTPAVVNGFVTMKAILGKRNDDRSLNDPSLASRPFSVDRAGFIMSEGAGAIVLATRSVVEQFGLKIQAILRSWATNSDGYHLAKPHPERVALCLSTALNRAGIHPEQVDYYNAHGTSTPINDRVETEAIKSVFGDHARSMPISSIKGAIGHSLGAASAIEAAVAVRSLQTQTIPPTLNYQADPELDLDYVPNEPRDARLNLVVSASFGFGGTNNALVFGRSSG